MKILIVSVLLITSTIVVSLPAVASPQNKLPEYGDITDLRGLSKVYVTTDTAQVRKYVLDKLKSYPALTVTGSPEEADFILECVQTGRIGEMGGGSVSIDMATFEMTAYILKDGRKRIAWSKTKNSLRYPPTLLTGDFISALKKSQKGKN